MITKEGLVNQDVCIFLAEKYNLSLDVITKIVSSQFKVLAESIKNGKEVEIIHIGKFMITKQGKEFFERGKQLEQ